MSNFTVDRFPETFGLCTTIFNEQIARIADVLYSIWLRAVEEGHPLILDDASIKEYSASFSNECSYDDALMILDTFANEIMTSYDMQEQYYYAATDTDGAYNDFVDFMCDCGMICNQDEIEPDENSYIDDMAETMTDDQVMTELRKLYLTRYGRHFTEDQESELWSYLDTLNRYCDYKKYY